MANMGQQNAFVTAPAISTASATLVAASGAGRRTRYVFNDSAGNLYVRLGTTAASATDFSYKLATQTGVTIEGYGGQVTGVLDAGTGAARVTEW